MMTLVLREAIKDAIEALERNSTSAPVVECLKAALAAESDEKPVAWQYDYWTYDGGEFWQPQIDLEKPGLSSKVRNVRPLFAYSKSPNLVRALELITRLEAAGGIEVARKIAREALAAYRSEVW